MSKDSTFSHSTGRSVHAWSVDFSAFIDTIFSVITPIVSGLEAKYDPIDMQILNVLAPMTLFMALLPHHWPQ
jgi:hypothetical protein